MRIFSAIIDKIRLATSTCKIEDKVSFQCNICGTYCHINRAVIGRETPSCDGCGSTVRMRSIINILSMELFGDSLVIESFPFRPDIKGIGMSDWDGYAKPLAKKIGYTNTFYHKEPRLDITTIDPSMEGTFDFLISTDVFEHIVPPISVAFENSRKLLKPGGKFIFTAPYLLDASSVAYEHFPDLYDYKIVNTETGSALHNLTLDGEVQVFDNLIFHGGEGATLEMRAFTLDSLLKEFKKAGFDNVRIVNEPYPKLGIYWDVSWSLPMIATA